MTAPAWPAEHLRAAATALCDLGIFDASNRDTIGEQWAMAPSQPFPAHAMIAVTRSLEQNIDHCGSVMAVTKRHRARKINALAHGASLACRKALDACYPAADHVAKAEGFR